MLQIKLNIHGREATREESNPHWYEIKEDTTPLFIAHYGIPMPKKSQLLHFISQPPQPWT